MKILVTILTSLFLSFLTFAQTKPTSNELPSLSKARELGRSKSNLLTTTNTVQKSSVIPTADINGFKKGLAPIFQKNCVACHGPKKVKGKFRIDELNPDLLNGPHINEWLEVYEVLSNSEMPPDDEPDYHLGDKERSFVIDWLGTEMNKASQVRRNEGGHSSFRRLAKYEYNNALQDLLGLPYNFTERLPTETISEDGFKNSSEHLNMTAMQFETYREIGLQALKKATVIGERPPLVTYSISMQEEMAKLIEQDKKKANSKNKKKHKTIVFNKKDKNFARQIKDRHLFNPQTGDAIIFKGRSYSPVTNKQAPALSSTSLVLNNNQDFQLNLGNHLPDSGTMRIRIRAGRTVMVKNQYNALRILFGAQTSNNANFKVVASQKDLPVTAPADKPQYIVFDIPLTEIPRNPFRKNKTKFPRRDELLTIKSIANGGPLPINIDHIEIIAPYYQQWPPKTHKAIFPDSKNKNNEKQYSQEILEKFMTRAWRRPAKTDEVKLYADLFSKYRPEFTSFEETMLEVLSTVLAAPEFLYLIQSQEETNDKTISDMELASRLAIFLWSSVPDNTLLKLAQQRKLKDPKVLAAQVKRMLADSRSQRFSKSFVTQWLGLEALNHVIIDKKQHRHFNDNLKAAMLQEPIAYFNEVLSHNNSIIDFIHSDYAVINETLARHYKIRGDIHGPQFRKVAISEKVNRGGILTSAALLTMNSDGKDSHPIKRGVWLLERILNDPPPPPPPNVPEVDLTDPEILKMTLKERIENHRDNAACRSCHTKIDPWGVAFENYDAIGSYRTKVKNNKPVDATSTLFNKQEIAGVDGLKRYLLSDRQDQFARAMVHKMTAYALGRPLTFSDRQDIDGITIQLRKNGDGLGDLVNLIINSKIFHSK